MPFGHPALTLAARGVGPHVGMLGDLVLLQQDQGETEAAGAAGWCRGGAVKMAPLAAAATAATLAAA